MDVRTLSVWGFLLLGYLATVACETPVLVLFLSSRHNMRTRVFAGFWLTACTYPIVILTLPGLTGPYYTATAESFAAGAEMLLFRWIAPRASVRDLIVVAGANLFSFLTGYFLWG
jgi:hypothetical protein